MDSMLSQEEINALLNGIEGGTVGINNLGMLTDEEKDAIGEISNISMGTAATTLSQIINKPVLITTPVVNYSTWDEVASLYERPCIMVEIAYRVGLSGSNVLILEENDVRIIADLMMGGDGTGIQEGELGELHLSAISEAMNQMMGSAATSLSSMLERKIDISPPAARVVDTSEEFDPANLDDFLKDTFVKVAFKMEVEGLIDSQLMHLYPMSFARELYSKFMNEQTEAEVEEVKEPEVKEEVSQTETQPIADNSQGMPEPMVQPMAQPNAPIQPQGGTPYGMPQYAMPNMQFQMFNQQPEQSVNVQPAQFASFSGIVNPALQNENIDLIMDVPLEVTVELGRTNKSIKEILEFKPGTIVELNRIAGEPIDILVNGKFVAKGEVVVIDESFGIRITDITK